MPDHYDVIIIGSGAGGGTLAHRLVGLRPAEHLRPDGDSEEDLEHDRGEPERREPDRERSDECDRCDDRNGRERDLHALSVAAPAGPLHPLVTQASSA